MMAWTGVCLVIGDHANGAVALGFGMGAILWAAAILALEDRALRVRLLTFRYQQTAAVKKKPQA